MKKFDKSKLKVEENCFTLISKRKHLSVSFIEKDNKNIEVIFLHYNEDDLVDEEDENEYSLILNEETFHEVINYYTELLLRCKVK